MIPLSTLVDRGIIRFQPPLWGFFPVHSATCTAFLLLQKFFLLLNWDILPLPAEFYNEDAFTMEKPAYGEDVTACLNNKHQHAHAIHSLLRPQADFSSQTPYHIFA